MADYKTPGVYIVEKNAFPSSAVAVETAVPVFIGYTEKAERKGKDLTRVPTRISSMAEYFEIFGGPFHPTFKITPIGSPGDTRPPEGTPVTPAAEGTPVTPAAEGTPVIPAAEGTQEGTAAEVKVADATEDPFTLNGKKYSLTLSDNNELYFFTCLRFFYLNGGSDCYIVSVGSYEDVKKAGISKNDFLGDTTNKIPNVFDLLEKEYEPTLVLLPDVVALKPTAEDLGYYALYGEVLKHCNKTQSRFGIFDVARSTDGTNKANIDLFREKIGSDFLKYGAAYYPWLKTSVIDASEINFTNLDASVNLNNLLPEAQAKDVLTKGPGRLKPLTQEEYNAIPTTTKKEATLEAENKKITPETIRQNITNYHQSLVACSPSYKQIMEELRSRLNLLPPSSAMAGIYTLVDTARGVWKSPANVSVGSVNAPEVNISGPEQETLNVDPVSGKSINIIRAFPGIGTLVWGARTLDGNSQDWRYINVRRTLIMIEQSLKLATRAYVFEPNDSGTWVTLQSMMNNFLLNLWKQGALAGAAPAQAYSVQVGLGVTMTPNDILDGVLRITVLIAIVRPAEFIEITFQQQQQQS